MYLQCLFSYVIYDVAITIFVSNNIDPSIDMKMAKKILCSSVLGYVWHNAIAVEQ